MKSRPASILFLLLLTLLINKINAQWTPVTEDLENNKQADYATDQVAFLAGLSITPLNEYLGHIAKSTDGGQSFSIIRTQYDSEYTAVHFINEQLGFVAGDHELSAVVLRTKDGGISWETTILQNTPPRFQDIYFINEDVGFIVGGNGIDLIYQTKNGGDTWENISFSDGPTLKDIMFLDDSIGFVISDWGPIYKTIDQGDTWEPIEFLPPHTGLDAMYFINEEIGLIADYEGDIYRTVNGGEDWSEIILPGVGNPDLIQFYFVNDVTGFLFIYDEIDEQRKLFQTTNSGESWTEIFNLIAPRRWTTITFSPTNTNALIGGTSHLHVNTNAEELVITSSVPPTIKELSVFDIHPNPAKDEIEVSLAFNSDLPFRINLLDVLGSVYESRQFENSEVNIKIMLDQRAPGVYVVQVITDSGVAVKSFVKR